MIKMNNKHLTKDALQCKKAVIEKAINPDKKIKLSASDVLTLLKWRKQLVNKSHDFSIEKRKIEVGYFVENDSSLDDLYSVQMLDTTLLKKEYSRHFVSIPILSGKVDEVFNRVNCNEKDSKEISKIISIISESKMMWE